MRGELALVIVLTAACGGARTAEAPPATTATPTAVATPVPVTTLIASPPLDPLATASPDASAMAGASPTTPFAAPLASPGLGAPVESPPGSAMPESPGALSAASPSTSLRSPAPAAADDADPVLRVQVALDRAGFSPGEIDGKEGSSSRAALVAYAAANRLTGPAAREALLRDGMPALVTYTITPEDVAGPFTKVPQDMMAKAELKALGFASAAEALGEKFHASPALLERLNPGKAFRAGETVVVPNVARGVSRGKAGRVVVDKSDASVSVFDPGDRVVARFPATMGSARDPLPIGQWKVNGVSRNPTFNYNPDLFWNADDDHAKAKIAPGPNSPVGVAWIDLSKPHYGIHGTPEPAQIGKTQSHGCIRLTNWDVATLADMVAPGTPVVLQE